MKDFRKQGKMHYLTGQAERKLKRAKLANNYYTSNLSLQNLHLVTGKIKLPTGDMQIQQLQLRGTIFEGGYTLKIF